jgi:hypothetical protein
MKTIRNFALAATILAAAAGTPLSAESRAERNEARLAEMLEGRTAGEGQNCISAFNSNRIEVIENVGIVYDAGHIVWVARASRPNDLGAFDVPIVERRGSQLCKFDIIRTVDRSTGMHTGSVLLEDFVPYTRAAEG